MLNIETLLTALSGIGGSALAAAFLPPKVLGPLNGLLQLFAGNIGQAKNKVSR